MHSVPIDESFNRGITERDTFEKWAIQPVSSTGAFLSEWLNVVKSRMIYLQHFLLTEWFCIQMPYGRPWTKVAKVPRSDGPKTIDLFQQAGTIPVLFKHDATL